MSVTKKKGRSLAVLSAKPKTGSTRYCYDTCRNVLEKPDPDPYLPGLE